MSLGDTKVGTKDYGEQDVERVQAYSLDLDANTVTDEGLRLIFWQGIRDAVRRNTRKGVMFTVGVIEQVKWDRYEDGSRYDLTVPEAVTDNLSRVESLLLSIGTADKTAGEPPWNDTDKAPF